MKIVVLQGSPRKVNTYNMVKAFEEGAKEAGHEVEIFDVAKMNISGCMACEYCHTKGEGKCVQKDDMQQIYPALLECDMLVLASPIYYFGMTAQIQAAINRIYAMMKPPKAKKAALLLSSMSPGVYTGAVEQYKSMMGFMGIEDCGIITAKDPENSTPEKLEEVKKLALSL